jgi:predicted Zn-dependent peptidase
MFRRIVNERGGPLDGAAERGGIVEGETFAGFRVATVAGRTLLWLRDDRFKTFRIVLSLRRPLDARAAARSLLPSLLLQGTERDADRPAIARRMELLHGATVAPGTHKQGEAHALHMVLDAVADRFLPGAHDQLGDGLALLGDLLLRPRLVDGAFPADAFAREKTQSLDAVRALFEDKGTFARRRALTLACDGEPYGILEDGGEAGIAALDARDPEHARVDFLRHGEAVFVAMGALPESGFVERVAAFAAGLPASQPQPIGDPTSPARRAQRRTIERTELQQSKLVLVHRVPWTRDEDAWLARTLAANLLGGGPHSRLFREVREKRSLAYYAHAQLDPSKGLMLTQIGLDEAAAEEAEAQVTQQLVALARGDFTDAELATARAGVLSALQQVDDGIGVRIDFTLRRLAAGTDRTPQSLAARFAAVTREAVAAAAAEYWPDHSYLLAGAVDDRA